MNPIYFFHFRISCSTTLRVQTFAGTNFRGFADFGQIRESLSHEKILIRLNRESLFPRNICFCSHPLKLISINHLPPSSTPEKIILSKTIIRRSKNIPARGEALQQISWATIYNMLYLANFTFDLSYDVINSSNTSLSVIKITPRWETRWYCSRYC